MFGVPKHGWVTVDIGGHKNSASYLRSVAIYVLERCRDFLEGKTENFYLEFDAEGYTFGVVSIGYDCYYWECKDEMKIELIDPEKDNDQVAKAIAVDLIQSIKDHKEEWLSFEALDESDSKYVETSLDELIAEVEKRLNSREMELGNLLFGNSRGKYPVERGGWEELFIEFLKECGFDTYGHIDNDKLEENLKTVYGDAVNEVDGEKYAEHVHYFDNGTFVVMPYFWGESENIAAMPNFVYKPLDYQIQWYKYCFRDAWANKQISFEEFKDILQKCKESLKKGGKSN